MRFLFLIDPLESLRPRADTSLALMEEAARRGIACEACGVKDVGVAGGVPVVRARPVRVGRDGRGRWAGPARVRAVEEYGAVWYRKDPPFDLACLHACQLLSLAKGRTVFVNDPDGLIRANEKLFALRFPDLVPPTLVTRHRDEALRFVEEVGEAVAKPLDGFGGVGVLRLGRTTPGAAAVVDALTEDGRRPALFQAYLPEVESGDHRVFVVFGKIVGVMHRIPARGDFRANLHAGGRSRVGRLSPEARRTALRVARAACAEGLFFAGLDLVGDRLLEVNVTSPTGLVHHHRDGGPNLVARLVKEVIKRINRGRMGRGRRA